MHYDDISSHVMTAIQRFGDKILKSEQYGLVLVAEEYQEC